MSSWLLSPQWQHRAWDSTSFPASLHFPWSFHLLAFAPTTAAPASFYLLKSNSSFVQSRGATPRCCTVCPRWPFPCWKFFAGTSNSHPVTLLVFFLWPPETTAPSPRIFHSPQVENIDYLFQITLHVLLVVVAFVVSFRIPMPAPLSHLHTRWLFIWRSLPSPEREREGTGVWFETQLLLIGF